jgi:hypothetical protein
MRTTNGSSTNVSRCAPLLTQARYPLTPSPGYFAEINQIDVTIDIPYSPRARKLTTLPFLRKHKLNRLDIKHRRRLLSPLTDRPFQYERLRPHIILEMPVSYVATMLRTLIYKQKVRVTSNGLMKS